MNYTHLPHLPHRLLLLLLFFLFFLLLPLPLPATQILDTNVRNAGGQLIVKGSVSICPSGSFPSGTWWVAADCVTASITNGTINVTLVPAIYRVHWQTGGVEDQNWTVPDSPTALQLVDIVTSTGYITPSVPNFTDWFLISTPSQAPVTGRLRVYAKTGAGLCWINSASQETCTGIGNGTPGGSTGQIQVNSGTGLFTGITLPSAGLLTGASGPTFGTALASDIIALFSTCSGIQYLGADAHCHNPGGVTSFTGDGALLTNSSSTGSVTATLGAAAAHKYWGNSTGISAAPSYSSITTADLPLISLTAGITGILPTANGGTGVNNTSTITLGTSNHNYATLSTGLIKNTTTTGALSIATSSDIISLFSTCSGVQYLGADGACHSVGASGVTAFTGDGTFSTNSSSTGSVTLTLANAAAHKYWGNPTGVSAAPGYNSLVAADLPAIPLTTGVSGVLPPANGGTGIANTSTLTLGTTNQNWASLASGLVKNTTTTGALSTATSTDIISLFTTCSGLQYLGADGGCHSIPATGVISLTGDGSLFSNSASTGSVTLTLGAAGAHKYWGNNTGTSGAPTYNSLVAADLPSISLTTGVSGILPGSSGGTGVNNTATLTLGSSNQNWSTLATGIVKNTTSTGALSAATSTDIISLFSTCSGTQYLGADGACHSVTPGGVTSFSGDGIFLSNSSSTGAVTATIANAAAHKYWGNSTGGSALPSYSSITTADLPSISLTTGITGILPTANGGTGVNNTATLTLGTSNQNYATLGTGLIKNTTTTGALSNAASGDIIALFSTCSGTQYLGADGACHTSASGGIADPGGNGILSRTALNTTVARTITGTSNLITVSNGDGVSGNPTLTVGTSVVRIDQGNTYTTGSQDLSSATMFRAPVIASFTPTLNGQFGYDSTANQYKGIVNSTLRTFAFLDSTITGNAANVTGIVTEANGGTGSNITPGIAGHYLRSNGTHYVDSAILSGDVPTLNQSTTGTAAGLTAQYIDWNASSGGTAIANKPTLGAMASGAYPGAGVPNSTGTAWGTSYTVGTGVNNLVQLNGSSQLPAVSAALLTNFPTLNQSTTGTASNVTGVVAEVNGGTGLANTPGAAGHVLRSNGTHYADSAILSGDLPGTISANTSGTSSNVTGIVAEINGGTGSAVTTGAAGHYLRSNGTHYVDGTVQSGDLPGSIAANTSGTAANLSGTPALPNGTTATTQAAANNSTRIATTAYVDAATGVAAASIYFNVMSYGAAGDGVTDDTAAIQSAINAATAAGGGTVFFPLHTYLLNHNTPSADGRFFFNINLGSNIKLLGVPGAKLLQPANYCGTAACGRHNAVGGVGQTVRNTVVAVGNGVNYTVIQFQAGLGSAWGGNPITASDGQLTFSVAAQAANVAPGDWIGVYVANSGDIIQSEFMKVVSSNATTGVVVVEQKFARAFPTVFIVKLTSLVTNNVSIENLIIDGVEPLAVTETFNFTMKNSSLNVDQTSIPAGMITVSMESNTVRDALFENVAFRGNNGAPTSVEGPQRNSAYIRFYRCNFVVFALGLGEYGNHFQYDNSYFNITPTPAFAQIAPIILGGFDVGFTGNVVTAYNINFANTGALLVDYIPSGNYGNYVGALNISNNYFSYSTVATTMVGIAINGANGVLIQGNTIYNRNPDTTAGGTYVQAEIKFVADSANPAGQVIGNHIIMSNNFTIGVLLPGSAVEKIVVEGNSFESHGSGSSSGVGIQVSDPGSPAAGGYVFSNNTFTGIYQPIIMTASLHPGARMAGNSASGNTISLPTTEIGTYTTLDGAQTSQFCLDAGATDSYACNLAPAITAYVVGAKYRFKANTINTGAASIAFNGLSALPIKKLEGGSITTDPINGDIKAGQWVECVYDGTNCQMTSQPGTASAASFTGDGALIGNFQSTGAITVSLATAAAHKYWGNSTGSTGAPSYSSITAADLPTATVLTSQTNAYSAATLQDLSASNLKLPTAGSFAASSSNNLGFDSTNNNVHTWNGADAILAPFASVPVTGHCAQIAVVSGKVTLTDTGSPCGPGTNPFNYHSYTYTSGTLNVDFSSFTTALVTASGANPTLSFTNPAQAGTQVTLCLANDTSARTWTISPYPGMIPVVASESVCSRADWTGSNYIVEGTNDTAALLRYSQERADPGTGGCPAGGCSWPDSASHNDHFRNSADTVFAKFKISGDCNPDTGVCTQLNGSNFTVNSSGVPTKIGGVSTSGSLGVAPIVADVAITNSSATSLVTLATSPGAGDYQIRYDLDLHTTCTTGTGSLTLVFGWTGNASRSVTTSAWSIPTTQGASVPFSGVLPIHVLSGNVTFTPTLSTACSTGTATWDGDISLVRVH